MKKKISFSPPIPILFLLFVICNGSWDGVIITESDFQGLQAIKHSLVDPTRVLSSWNGSGVDACSGSWVGIKCAQGQVIVIQLPWHGLGGRISEKIGQLRGLRKISIHDNAIGGQIPPALGFLPALRGLYLFNNRFSGTIPPELGKCPVLQAVDLSGNLLSGGIPEGIFNSSRLYRFHVSGNNLTGPIPTLLVKVLSLNFLYLDRNRLTGTIPEFRGGGKLQVLNLDNNSFSGTLPVSLGKLTMLKVISVRNNDINGSIPEELGSLPHLQTLDLSSNSIGGRFPTALCGLSSLVELNLDGNDLEGPLPEEMDGLLRNLTRLSVRDNQFTGSIPVGIGNVTKLTDLDVSGNNFTGEIPKSLERLVNLNSFNVSNNRLSGIVPPLLASKFNLASFKGNLQLCGYKGGPMCPMTSGGNAPIIPPPPESRKPKSSKFNNKEIILIAVGAVLVFLLLLCLVLILCLFNKKRGTTSRAVGEKPAAVAGTEVEGGGDAGGKLVHFDGPMAFTADDLLCATAEIMGKSSYGTVYKATLEDGSQVAVKRLREKIAKGQKEFEAEVNLLGKIRHPNLLALRAYYLGPKGEKLLVFDYMPKGSLAAFLHARGPETPIDWPTRMSIAIGCARGLHHLHTSESTIHGNMTSTNILLTTATTPVLADFSLYRLMMPSATASVSATAAALGYRAPELTKMKKPTTKSDVYSLGVVMLELLTGKSPGEAMNGVDLPQWVASIVREEWTNEVFDLELVRDAEAGDELLNTLKLALHCVDPSPAARPEVAEVIRQLEEIKPEVAGRGQDCREVETGYGSSSVGKKEEEGGNAGGVTGAPATTE